MRETDEIEVRVETRNDALILRPIGDVDLGRSPSLREHLREAQGKTPSKLIIDLVEVPYMDSSGVATLIEAMQAARKYNTNLVLCCMQEKVKSIFEIARLDMVFTIVGSVDDALSK